MSDVISRLIGKKFRKFSLPLAIQIRAVNSLTPKNSFLLDYGPRNIDLLKDILSELRKLKLIDENLKIATLESEIFIINVRKLMEKSCEDFHIIDISDNLEKPQLISDRLFFKELIEKIKEKLSENLFLSELIDLGEFGFYSPTIFGFLINYPVLYFCKTENNCLSHRDLKVFQIFDENQILMSFSVPLEVLNENQQICDDINQFLNNFQSHKTHSFVTTQENVIL